MSFSSQGIRAAYEDKVLQLRGFARSEQGIEGYDIFLGEFGEHHFYLPARVGQTISKTSETPAVFLQRLATLDASIPSLLSAHQISAEALYHSFRRAFSVASQHS